MVKTTVRTVILAVMKSSIPFAFFHLLI